MKIWDMPGAGTKTFPKETYIPKMGLRYFDVVFVVSAGRWKEHDMAIIKELEKHKVPHFVVRTKVDQDIESETMRTKFKSHAALYDNNRLLEDMKRVAGRGRRFTSSSEGQRAPGRAAQMSQPVATPVVWTPAPLVVAPRTLAHKPLHSTRSFCALARAMRRM